MEDEKLPPQPGVIPDARLGEQGDYRDPDFDEEAAARPRLEVNDDEEVEDGDEA